jgi:hypothetical protein
MPGHVIIDLINAKVDAERKVQSGQPVFRLGAAEIHDVEEMDDSDPHIDEVTHQNTGTRIDAVVDGDIYPMHSSNNNLGDDIMSGAEIAVHNNNAHMPGVSSIQNTVDYDDVDAVAVVQQSAVDLEELGVVQPPGQVVEDQIETELQTISNQNRYNLRPRGQQARQNSDYVYTMVNIYVKRGFIQSG